MLAGRRPVPDETAVGGSSLVDALRDPGTASEVMVRCARELAGYRRSPEMTV